MPRTSALVRPSSPAVTGRDVERNAKGRVMTAGARQLGGAAVALALLLVPALARAQDGARHDPGGDAYFLRVRSSTYLQLYQRALLPGPNGALVTTDTLAPAYEYVSLRADDLDSWDKDNMDVELSAWGSATFSDAYDSAHRVDGDLQTANVRFRAGPTWVRLGRQLFVGGAARFARFDGVSAGSQLAMGLGAEAYTGLSVLPRWNGRPGYAQLGATADTLLRDPQALPEPKRSGYWLAGGRIYYSKGPVVGGLSLHEQHESSELARRDLGADLRVEPLKWASLGGNAILDVDSMGLADARLWADTTPIANVDVGAEYLHTEPALLLSRQSVLSVFSTDTFDEVGSTASWRPLHSVGIEGGGYIELYSAGDTGARGEIAVRLTPDRNDHTILRLGFTRVRAPGNGYSSLRDSLRQRITASVAATAEAYLYLYDESIRGYRTSSVFAGTVEWNAMEQLRFMLGSSLANTPYSKTDLQAMLRVAYGFDAEAP